MCIHKPEVEFFHRFQFFFHLHWWTIFKKKFLCLQRQNIIFGSFSNGFSDTSCQFLWILPAINEPAEKKKTNESVLVKMCVQFNWIVWNSLQRTHADTGINEIVTINRFETNLCFYSFSIMWLKQFQIRWINVWL